MVGIKVKKRGLKDSFSDRVFFTINTILMIVFLFIMLYPLYFTLIASISDVNEVGLGNVYLFPKGFTLEAYQNVFINSQIWIGYRNTIVYTTGGVLYSLFIMLPAAYALSKKTLFARGVITWFFLITMYFSGGIIPTYLLIRSLGLLNTPWAIILGGTSVWHLVVTRTYFSNAIPNELYESASIDGAGEFTRFFRIALPLATPIIAVMALYQMVGYWNSYFNALLYINKQEMFPLQLVLRQILIANQSMYIDPSMTFDLDMEETILKMARLAQSMRYALIFIASAPLLIAYPFVQKYFIQGIMIGSLKG